MNPVIAETSFGAYIDNDWFNANNWTNGLPSNGNDANIGSGITVEINQPLTISFSVTSYGTIDINAAVTNNGTLNNFFGSINLGSSGSISNLGIFDNRGALNIAVGGSYFEGEGGSFQPDGSNDITNDGTINIFGSFPVNGNLTNNGTFISNADIPNQGTIDNNGLMELNGGELNNTNGGASFNNRTDATLKIKSGALFTNFGTTTNDGTISNHGEINNVKYIVNNGLFNNNGGLLTSSFSVVNNGTFNNNNLGVVNNNFTDFDNYGELNNSFEFNNAGNLNHLGGTFTNNILGTVNNQLGSEIRIHASLSNLGTINSEGDVIIKDIGTLTNENLLFAQTNGTIQNFGNFINNNTIQNFDIVVNHTGGIFQNPGTITIQNGSVTNNGDFYNTGRLTNELELINNQNLYNTGTIENGVRIFNNGFFNNAGYLLNIGDFDNNVTGNFTNDGAIDNTAGGIISNFGEFNNDNEIFNLGCSSFINAPSGIINNTSWITNKSIFWNYGTINGNGVMNMFGGILTTDGTSTETCESITATLDGNGQALILGTSVAVSQFDTCGTLIFTVDDLEEIILTCDNKGPNTVTLTIEDRKGNAVTCSSTITIIDDQVPTIENCPTEVIVTTTETSAPATWTPPTASDNCDIPTLTSTNNPGDVFQLGTTIVTYTATDSESNTTICDFPVIVVQDGDCSDIKNIRRVTDTNNNCGNWCSGAYAFTLGPDQCYNATNDLLFIEYRDGTALLTGTVARGIERASVYVEFSGFSAMAPADSPKYGLCVNSGASDWTYYQEFTGWVTFDDCSVMDISRFGPSFQIGTGANLQEQNEFGGAAWFEYGGAHEGDFNFRLSAPIECQRSIYLEAECAEVGSRWSILNDDNASNGQYLLPPGGTSYDVPPSNPSDIVKFTLGVTQAGQYRIYTRSLAADGGSDSYWVRINNGNWTKYNKVNSPNQGNSYEWDQVSLYSGCSGNLPLTFGLIPGSNTIEIAWREPNIRLDKLFVTLVGKKPSGMGDMVDCDGNPPVDPEPCNKEVLFVVGNTQLNAGDTAIKNRLESNGYNVMIVDDWDSQTSDANGKGVVIISSTVNSSEVNTKFRDVAVPVITWEGWLMDDMKMVGNASGTDYGTHIDNDLDISDSSHPIAAGLTGEIDIYTADDELNFGKPSSSAAMIAHVDDDPAWPVLFAYESGASMKGMNAPARRVGFFLRDNGASRFTNDGWKLFDQTVVWAIGSCDDQNNEPPVPCNLKALFVAGSSSPHSGDLAVKARLESLGYSVKLVDDDYCATSDADGMGLVYISSSVSSSKVGRKYRDIAIPVVTSEAWIYDDMKMTGTGSGTNYGEYAYTSNMTIGDSNHPIVQGITGNLQVLSSAQKVAWGNPGNGASRIGYVPGEPGCGMLFAYEKGAHMVGMNAPERRVGIFLRNSNTMNALNNTGWLLFDATIQWAAGCDGSRNNIDEDFTAVLDLDAYRNEREVQLIWKNNTAFKNAFITLEKSMDGLFYNAINEWDGFIEEDESMNVFQDADVQPEIGKNYYRIKIEHLDGTLNYSNVEVIEFEELGDFTLYPNPASTYTKVNLENVQGQTVSIQLFDLIGHQLQQIDIETVEKLDYRLDLTDLRDGQYIVAVIANGRKPVTKKLFVSK
jgi:hypothetical protein